MMKSRFAGLVPVLAMTVLFAVSAFAQKLPPAAPYSITAVNVTKFDKMSGEFGERMKADDTGNFLNELDLTFFVSVEVSGKGGDYAPGRKVQITVTEGKRAARITTVDIGVINQQGKYFVPVFLTGPFCTEVKIGAKVLGQKKQSSMTRKLVFDCGE